MNEYKRILVPVDFSEISDEQIQIACRFRLLFGSEIVLAHCVDYDPPNYASAEIPELYLSRTKLKQQAKEWLNKLASKFEELQAKIVVQVDKPKKGVVSIAQDLECDLIIIGKHDPTVMEKFLGSTTHSVVNHANCDLLVIHG